MDASKMGFGRKFVPDDRDNRFLMRLVLDPFRDRFFPQGLPAGVRHYRSGPTLNQGATGTCVAHAWVAWSQGAPLMVKPTPDMNPMALYDRIVKIDEWSDNDNDIHRQFGTSVRAGAKLLQSEGRIANYFWAKSSEDIRAWHLAGFGTCVLGVNWYTGMFDTDKHDFLQVTGRVEGGHAIKTTGWSDTRDAVRIKNSWGRDWSKEGHAWISRADLDRLLSEDGEACAAVEQRLV